MAIHILPNLTSHTEHRELAHIALPFQLLSDVGVLKPFSGYLGISTTSAMVPLLLPSNRIGVGLVSFA